MSKIRLTFRPTPDTNENTMSTALIKQVQYLKENGFTEQQANTLIYFHKDSIENVMASKTDIAEVKKEIAEVKKEIAEVQANLKRDIEQLRADTKKDIEHLRAEVKKDMSLLQKDMSLLKRDIEQLRADTKKDIEHLRGEVKKDIEYLRGEVKKDILLSKRDLIIKLSGIMGGMITIACIVLGFLIRL